MAVTTEMKESKQLTADWPEVMRTFIRPENDATKTILTKYMEQILFGLHDFLKTHVGVTEEIPLEELACRFDNSLIHRNPEKKLEQVITELIEDIAPYAVNVHSPYFVGHMTAAIPFFMVHLKAIIAALNQNVVKLETSKVVSLIERQVLAKIHRLIFRKDEEFYSHHIQNARTALGSFTDGGTLANLTALWVARNTVLSPKPGFKGIEAEGIAAAYRAYGIEKSVVLVSKLGHFSLNKAGGVLGIGNQNIVPVNLDSNYRLDINDLLQKINEIKSGKGRVRILAVVGIAGTTETGSVDPLRRISEICSYHKIHFHVDAAWGGPTLMSARYNHLINGIELADSVTIDGHKQFYMPMSCGMVYFKDPAIMDTIAYHANYVNRPGSADLGIKSLSGSREATSLILDSALQIMGKEGYSLLIDHGIDTAKRFAEEIRKRPLFQLVTAPELNILTYRICPKGVEDRFAAMNSEERNALNTKLNKVNRTVQRLQRESGKSFVSRTTLKEGGVGGRDVVVLRSVIMNPMTTIDILKEILDEQEEIYRREFKWTSIFR
jgi:putative pyridoxal-dependent aspartate 1-decarboxylase